MCGICGIVGAEPAIPEQTLSQMQAAMVHRGPDGAGRYVAPHVGLAMRRLSVIDPKGGWQPLYNEDRSVALVANGEIYNFVELRAQLQAKGHRFATGSDCETIAHLYEEYGVDCVSHLRGMFAFALWDASKRFLMLARDRMGEKPLYLYERQGALIFASEIKALLKSGWVDFQLDPTGVNLFFYFQFTPEPLTPIKGVRKLPAAHALTLTLDPWQIQETRYWRLEDSPRLEGPPAELIRAELERISEIVIRSDVPIGVALSGGLDSSAVAALALRKYPDTVHAFTVGYPGRPPYDERQDAQAFANYLKMPFHEIELDAQAMVDFFPELVAYRDDPIADISGYNYYTVMKLARDCQVPVMLQGQGGDELFWGYPWVKQALVESRDKAGNRYQSLNALVNCFKPTLPETHSIRGIAKWAVSLAGLKEGWKRFKRHQDTHPNELIFYHVHPDYQLAENKVNSLYTSHFLNQLNQVSPADLATFPKPWQNVDILLTSLICQTYLLGNGITQGDRLSMASSVEPRLPLVDYRLVETVIGLRKANPDDALGPKFWFKQAIKDVLPEWVMNRPKRGFQPPTRQWHQALFHAYGAQLKDGYLAENQVLNPNAARALAKGLFPKGVNVPLSFKALTLEIWCRKLA